MSAAIATGALAAAGIYLLLQRGIVRIVLGFLVLQHAVNLLLVTARAPQRWSAPILPVEAPADPLGQAFVLTAIVIGFGTTIFLLAVALRLARLRRMAAGSGEPTASADDVESMDGGEDGGER